MKMKSTLSRPLLAALAVAVLMPLGGCVSFGAKPPKQLLTLSADKRFATGDAQRGSTGTALTVLDPDAAKKLDTIRIPVEMGGTSIAYIKGGAWVDAPRRMFQRLLAETISSTGRLVLDPGQFTTDPGTRLMGQLVDFGIDEGSNSAVVTYDAMLLSADGKTVTKRRFQARAPVQGKIEAVPAAEAINRAANEVAGQVTEWVAQ